MKHPSQSLILWKKILCLRLKNCLETFYLQGCLYVEGSVEEVRESNNKTDAMEKFFDKDL